MSRWDDAIRAALLSGVRPAIDPRDVNAADLGHFSVAAAFRDQGFDRGRHCDKLRSSQPAVNPPLAKIARDMNCDLHKIALMATDPFSSEWMQANFAASDKTQADLARYLKSKGLNVDESKISKMTNNRRTVKPEERIHVWEFFGYHRDQLYDALLLTHPDAGNQPDILPLKEKIDADRLQNKDELERIEKVWAEEDRLGQPRTYHPKFSFPEPSPLPNAGLPENIPPSSGTMPILGKSVGGNNKSRSLFNGEVLGHVNRPGNLVNKARAYATYVHGDSMEPRYEAGEIVLVNPDKGYRKGNYVVAQVFDNEGDPPFGYIKKFISFGEELVLEQLNPPDGEDKIMRFARNRVVAVHRIVGTLDE